MRAAAGPGRGADKTTVGRRGRQVTRLGWLVVVGWGVALGTGVLESGVSIAYFSDEAEAAGNVFQTATLDLSVSPASALVSFSNMQPGDQTNGTLTISNSGSSELRYAMTTEVAGDSTGLAEALELVIKTEGTSCAAFDGQALYSGVLGTASIGDPLPGSQTGDRTLSVVDEVGESEELCFRVTLPTTVGNAQQAAEVEIAFRFFAEQTANNP